MDKRNVLVLLIVCVVGTFLVKLAQHADSSPHLSLYELMEDISSCDHALKPEIILGRPTFNSVTVKIWSHLAGTYFLQYGPDENLTLKTFQSNFNPDNTVTEELQDLQEMTRYFYQIVYQYEDLTCSGELSTFITGRAIDENFSFSITSDFHYLGNTWDPQLLEVCLASIASTQPDFLIDLGNTFMGLDAYTNHTIHIPYETLFHEYSTICHSIPLYLVNGFKDGEDGWELSDNSTSTMPVIIANTRRKYYANPEPNLFYSGNESPFYGFGFQQDYYAWFWGGSLFVTIDPNWYSRVYAEYGFDCGMGWCWTLGLEQYTWLTSTLSDSNANFKFVFTHSLLGGAFGPEVVVACGKGQLDSYNGFGGKRWIQYFEWGGNDEHGDYAFQTYRPDWPNVPLHTLFVNSGVDIVFKGQDLFYSKFTSDDGLLYLTVPHPWTNNMFEGTVEYSNKLICHGYDPDDPTVNIAGGYFSVQVTPTTATVYYKTVDGGQIEDTIVVENKYV